MTLKISSKSKASYKKTAKIIKNGGIAIVPTETVYGFAVDIFNSESKRKVYNIKKRNYDKPLIVMAYNTKILEKIVEIHEKTLKITNIFWPGQLTLILPSTEIGQILSSGKKSLGVRIPDNKFMLNLLKELDTPVFTTSVNISGMTSAKNFHETLLFDNAVDIIVNGGQCDFALESTIIDMVKFPYTVIRNGCLDASKILTYI
ncbi:MAG: threonylcarbamoyl-AMP synthase [Endomicrobium sp.]|nr:threonylcarbamoyl-AMP synthase [Endomicrobium sp.]